MEWSPHNSFVYNDQYLKVTSNMINTTKDSRRRKWKGDWNIWAISLSWKVQTAFSGLTDYAFGLNLKD